MPQDRSAYIPRSGTVAWGPTTESAGMIATGTVAGAFSDNFDASAALEVFSLDLGSASGECTLVGSVNTNERFHRLAWGTGGVANGSLRYGMLAGGMVDGTVKVYDPAKMMSGAGGEGALLANLEKHTGEVRALEFNPGMPTCSPPARATPTSSSPT